MIERAGTYDRHCNVRVTFTKRLHVREDVPRSHGRRITSEPRSRFTTNSQVQRTHVRDTAAGDGSAKQNVMNNLPYTHVIRFAENNRFFFVDSEIVFRSVGGRAIKIAEKTRGRDRGNLDGKTAVRRVRAAPSVLDIFYIVYLKVFFSLRTR